jgi:hypothetical protein
LAVIIRNQKMAKLVKMSAMTTVIVSFILVAFSGLLFALLVPVEAFFGAQGGEMVQLAAGRVPTMVDLREEQEEAKQVQKEIINMTGYW